MGLEGLPRAQIQVFSESRPPDPRFLPPAQAAELVEFRQAMEARELAMFQRMAQDFAQPMEPDPAMARVAALLQAKASPPLLPAFSFPPTSPKP